MQIIIVQRLACIPVKISTIPFHKSRICQPIHLRAFFVNFQAADIKPRAYPLLAKLFVQTGHQTVGIPAHFINPLFGVGLPPGQRVRSQGPQNDFQTNSHFKLVCLVCRCHQHDSKSVNASLVLGWLDCY